MATIFKHNNEYYQCVNLKKKLKRLKIDESDIEILFEGELSQSDLEKKYLELTQVNEDNVNDNDVKLYYFYNKDTGYSITSIYPECKEEEGYERCTKKNLETYWNQARKV